MIVTSIRKVKTKGTLVNARKRDDRKGDERRTGGGVCNFEIREGCSRYDKFAQTRTLKDG